MYADLQKANLLRDEHRRPELGSATFLYRAFHEMDGDRAIGFSSIGRIPWTVIVAYADRYKLSEAFIQAIQELDREYVKQNNGRRSKSSQPQPTATVFQTGNSPVG